MAQIAFVGGTGHEGMGLAVRLAVVGDEVLIGSRNGERARAAARRVAEIVPTARVHGRENEAVCAAAEIVALCLPFSALRSFLEAHAACLGGKIVIDVVNPIVRENGFFRSECVEGGVGTLIQSLAPASRVVSAFKTTSAAELCDPKIPLQGDVLVCADDRGAKEAVSALVRKMPHLRPLDAGPLAAGQEVEPITALLLNLNHHYGATSSVRIVGID